VGQARAEKVPFVVDEHLCLVLKPTESGGMNDAITITLKLTAAAWGRLTVTPAA